MASFACKYNPLSKYTSAIDELIIDWSDKSKDQLNNFCTAFYEKRIILNIKFEDVKQNIDFFKLFFLEHKDEYFITFKIDNPFDPDEATFLNQAKIPWFSRTVASNWDQFNVLAKAGVKDIYISGYLGFCLSDVRAAAHRYNDLVIRTIPNLAIADSPYTKEIYKFFIRPEDIDKYSDYIDVFEFYEFTDTAADVLYRAYGINKRWFGELREIIINIDNLDINNKHLPERFSSRATCGKKCYRCNLCGTLYETSKRLKDLKILIEPIQKEKEPISEGKLVLMAEDQKTIKKPNF